MSAQTHHFGRTMSTVPRRLAAVLASLLGLALLASCGVLPTSSAAESATPTTPPVPASTFDSQFTRDGTFQSHIEIDGIDFVYTIWPTKATPRTNDWFPKGDKYFSFTLQAYDLDRDFRDSFATKRRVWLGEISASSETTTESGQTEEPYRFEADAKKVTFDPQPVTNKYGMLITSPKGAFELRNQKIGTVARDTSGVTLTFEATVWVQDKAGKKAFTPEFIRQEVPIAIFDSSATTEAQKIPKNAN